MHLFERNSYLCHRVSYETRIFLLLNYPVELLPRKGLKGQTYTSLGLRTIAQSPTIDV